MKEMNEQNICKDCKWWKDSDGVYRRGVGAESQCPINSKKVYEGNGYCYMFKPHESESKHCVELAKSYIQGVLVGLAEGSGEEIKETSKEKQIQEYQSKQLIEELSKMPSMVIATAYLYAINYTLYGEDVTEKWLTATRNARALELAYREGYYDALRKMWEESRWIPVSKRLPKEDETVIASTEDGIYPEAKYTEKYGWEWAYESGMDYWVKIPEVVTAWMSLPERYEVENEEK